MAGEEVNLDRTLARVRALIAKAEAPIAEGATDTERQAAIIEQNSAREMADALMLKYAINEAVANATKPVQDRTKPIRITVEVGRWDADILGYLGQLCEDVADHCRCKTRMWGQFSDYTYRAKVYGFESDVRYFELLYTTLRLHMLGVLMPRMDPQLSLEENCYRLHEAGYNWLQMAAMDGWKKYPGQKGVPGHLIDYYNQGPNPLFDGRVLSGKLGGYYKRAYERACKAKGESTKIIPAGGTETYRRSAAMGYTSRLRQRLDAIKRGRDGTPGAGIVLRSRFEDVEAMFREDNPELFRVYEPQPEEPGKKVKVRMRKYVPPKFSDAGYGAGVSYANKADLNTGVGSKRAGEIS